MQPLHVVTPTWESAPLSRVIGRRVLLKMEALQPVGSFKIRGIGHACQLACARGARSLFTSSGGNAGYAVAYAARKLDVPATIVVPETTPEWMREILRSEGATVIEHGRAWDDAHAFASGEAQRQAQAYIHPFDDRDVWHGHASMIDELAADGIRPGVVVVAVGGGGLLCGVLEGMHAAGWTDVPVVAVETEGAASFAGAVAAGHLITLDRIRSLATTLGARRVASEALAWTTRHQIVPHLVTDRVAVEAVTRFADDHRVLVEPACGAALSVVYSDARPIANLAPVLVIVCGGASASLRLLREWQRQARQGPKPKA